MFRVNDVITYGTQGVCRIVDIEEKSVGGAKRNYFVLKPIGVEGSTIYVPTDNVHVLKKMRRLLTEDEIHALIASMPKENPVWVVNDAQRKELFRKTLAEGNHLALIQMIKAIYAHKKAREAEGKRLHMTDERFFRDAEQILYNEFQYVLQLSGKEELMQYILSRVQEP